MMRYRIVETTMRKTVFLAALLIPCAAHADEPSAAVRSGPSLKSTRLVGKWSSLCQTSTTCPAAGCPARFLTRPASRLVGLSRIVMVVACELAESAINCKSWLPIGSAVTRTTASRSPEAR